MSNEQVIDKIKALLALATGEGNDNEKKLALRRAQELMAKYSVDIGEEKEPEILQGIQDFKIGYKKERQIGYSNLFWKGFELGLHQRFTKISNEKALILYDKVKNKWDQMAKVNYHPDSFSGNGLSDGKRSALEAVLNPAIQSQRGNLLQ